jgi:hypothetical protein
MSPVAAQTPANAPCLNCGSEKQAPQIETLDSKAPPQQEEELTLSKPAAGISPGAALPFSTVGPLGTQTGTAQDLSILKTLQH